jgi:lincosamide nucleotidyltransferase A/C/D/E
MMQAQDVLAVIDQLDAANIPVWIDGGWGIDALLGAEHRPHDDVDIVVPLDRIAAVQSTLAPLGFVMHIDELPTRCVLRDPTDRRIDCHPVTFDATGVATQRLPDGTDCLYPTAGFAGRGVIGGRIVRCLTPEVQILHHLGYEPDEKDRHDIRLLCARFNLPLPEQYTPWS